MSGWKNQEPIFIAALNGLARDQVAVQHRRLLGLLPTALDVIEAELQQPLTKGRAARDLLALAQRMPAIGSTDPAVVQFEQTEFRKTELFRRLAAHGTYCNDSGDNENDDADDE